MMNPSSPFNAGGDTTLIDTFRSNDIITLYKNQFGIEVPHFFNAETFSLYECNKTGYRFYYPKGMDGDADFYAALQQRLGTDYYHVWKFENQLALNNIKPSDKLLDIGCGIGNFLIRAKEVAAEVCGLELNEKAVEVCKQRGLEVYNELIAEHIAKKEGYYDMVCMFQVLEHIYDVQPFLEDALKALKKDGKLVIGVPNNEPYFKGYDKYSTLNLPPHHMGLWNKKVFEKIAPLFKMEILETEYDEKGKPVIEAYLRAKYMSGVLTPAGLHTKVEKLKMLLLGFITVPLSVIKKITAGINGSHMVIVFKKL